MFEFDNSIPIYIQLVEQLKMDIISGKLKSGERLFSVRELAFKMKVNPNTMQKALAELESLNLIYTKRTSGKFVTDDKNLIEKYKRNYADEVTKKYVSSMKSLGFDNEKIVECLMKNGGRD